MFLVHLRACLSDCLRIYLYLISVGYCFVFFAILGRKDGGGVGGGSDILT